jgi:FecR protein
VQGHPISLRLALIISLFLLAATGAQAQGSIVWASVRSVTGIARIYVGPQSGAFAPKRNDQLEPGNMIETGQNGRVVISLSDGGQITVLPNSKVVLKNFRDAHSARELLDIALGRVLVKIHHIGVKPNPYRLNSPTASIAVRGTEFMVDVLPGGETLVLVREGLVEVWPHNNPDNKRLVSPGGKVVVRPGGDIGSVFTGPGSELNGKARYDGSLEMDYQRSIDSVAQNSNEISPVFFSAFPDPHLDSLENPAYAAEFKNAEGRLLLPPSISGYRSYSGGTSSSKDPPRFDYSISPQLTFFTPIPGSRLVIGGGSSASSVRSQHLTDYEFPDYVDYFYQAFRLNAINVSLVAAYGFGNDGGTSVGIGIDGLSGNGAYSSRFRFKIVGYNGVYNTEYLGDSNARFASTRLTFGLTRRFSEGKKLGLYYRRYFNHSDQEDFDRHKDESPVRPSYFTSSRANISTLSSSSQIGIRFRASLTKRLFYGVEGSYLYERIWNRREAPSGPITYSSYLGRRARIGGGLGFFLTSKILLNFDVTGGLFKKTELDNQPFGLGGASVGSSSTSLSFEQKMFVSAHAAIQANLWRNLFLSASSLATFHMDTYKFYYHGNEKRQLSNIGLGWKFKPNLSAEYLISTDHTYRVPSHSLRLRYTFNLGVTGEK